MTSETLPATMRTSVLAKAGELTVEDRPVPQPAADEVLVRVAAVGVCGSDTHYYREGRIGDFVVESPLVLGHEVSGQIVAVGADVAADRVGERVAIEPQRPCRVCEQCKAGRYNLCYDLSFYATPPVDGALCGYVTIPADFAYPVPDTISDEAAALMEPLSVAIWACRKAQVVPGSRVLIAGAGPIGVITTQAARAFGASEVIVTDPVASRREMAVRFGASAAFDPAAGGTDDLGVDAFIDASGAQPAIAAGIKAVRPAGYVVLVGLGAPEMSLPVMLIQTRELHVTGIFRYTDTWPTAIDLVARGVVDLDGLVTARFGLDEVQQALEADREPGALKAVVVL